MNLGNLEISKIKVYIPFVGQFSSEKIVILQNLEINIMKKVSAGNSQAKSA